MGRGKQIKFPPRFTARWVYLIDQEVILTTKDQYRHWIGVERHNGNIWLGRGWQAFTQEYNIQILDALYFRHKGNDFFNVVMFNGAGLEYRRKRESPTDLPISFCKQMVSGGYATRMVVPDEFTMTYGALMQNPTTLVGHDRVEWPVECTTLVESLCFTKGWTEFAINYNIKRMDFVCVKVCDTGKMRVCLIRQDIGMVDKALVIGPENPLDINDRVRELWTAELSKAAIIRHLALYVPSRIVSKCLEHRSEHVPVVLPTGDVRLWKLNWSEDRKDTCTIGDGWTQFKEEHKLKPRQRVRFSRRGYEDRFIVEIL